MTALKNINKRRPFSALRLFLSGLVIGLAAITPGLSGGVIAVALGIYAPTVQALTSLRRNVKENLLFLLPLVLGAAIGLCLFGIIMKPMLQHYEKTVIWLFSGLILGSIPSLWREAVSKGFRPVYLLSALIAFALGLLSGYAGRLAYSLPVSPPLLLLGGAVFALGMVIPGISSSIILLQLGIYDTLIAALVTPDVPRLLWIALGAAAALLLTLRLVNAAFQKFHGHAYFAALGFLLATTVMVIPRNGTWPEILLFFAGMVAVATLMRKKTADM